MPLTTTKQMLLDAQRGGYAIGAFNVENMEMAMAVVNAAQELRSPVILQTTPSTVRYASLDLYFAIAQTLAKNATVPVALHLDHGSSTTLCTQALCAGYTSIMIDASKLPLEENIALTKSVVDICASVDIPVEGELGQVGGKEDDTESEGGYTIPSEALRFEKETGVSSLAVGVGTAHGHYTHTPVLNAQLISELRGLLAIPLVLHGASGLADDVVRDCIHRGICKVNYATELRTAYSNGVRETLAQDINTFDPKAYGKAGIAKVRDVVLSRIKICGSAGKA